MTYAIGIDVGGTNIKTVAVTTGGDTFFQSQEPTDEFASAWAERIREQITRIQTQQNAPALCVGLAAPGLGRAGRAFDCLDAGPYGVCAGLGLDDVSLPGSRWGIPTQVAWFPSSTTRRPRCWAKPGSGRRQAVAT